MSTLGQNRPPISTRPWFAALALTVGASAMAFGAYTAGNPVPFSRKTLSAASGLAHAAAARKVAYSPATEHPGTPIIVLDDVRITAKATRRKTQKTFRADACAPNWRSLATGPTTRQVREFCSTSEDPPIQPTVSTRSSADIDQHLVAPRVEHENLGAIEEPTRPDSLGDLVPSTEANGD